MYCTNCGAELEPELSFCMVCGHYVEDDGIVMSNEASVDEQRSVNGPPTERDAQQSPVGYNTERGQSMDGVRAKSESLSQAERHQQSTQSLQTSPTSQVTDKGELRSSTAADHSVNQYSQQPAVVQETPSKAMPILVGLLVAVLVALVGFILVWALGYGDEVFGDLVSSYTHVYDLVL